MTSFRELLTGVLATTLEPVLVSIGFAEVTALRWRRGNLEVRAVVDSKAVDPYRGGAFTLEAERSDDGNFEIKLAGRARLDQLVDAGQRQQLLTLRNRVACRLSRPDAQHLALIPTSLRQEYLKAFEPVETLEPGFWMRYRSSQDASEWAELLATMLPDVIRRAQTLDPHALVLGQPAPWSEPQAL